MGISKAAFFDPNLLLKFSYSKNSESKMVAIAFELYFKDSSIEFTTVHKKDMFKLQNILKFKMNILGYQDYFRSIKLLGRGTSASVYFFNLKSI